MVLEVKVNAVGLLDVVRNFNSYYYPYLRKAIARSAGAFSREFKKGLSGPGRLKDPGRFGKGKLAFQYEVLPESERRGRLEDIRASIFTLHPAGPDLEHGAVKRSDRAGGKLAIPFGYAKRADGKVKRDFRRPREVAQGRDIVRKGQVVRRTKGRGLYLFFENNKPFLAIRLRGRNTEGKAKYRRIFRLVEKVEIDPKLFFFREWKRFQPEVLRREREEHRRFIREVLKVRGA